jgi:hypothetical protein
MLDKIVRAVASGVSRRVAARALGLGESTIHRYLQRIRVATRGPLREYRDRLGQAEATAEATLIARIANAGMPRTVTKTTVAKGPKGEVTTVVTERQDGDWKANAWLAERRWPTRWGRRDHTTIAGDQDAPAVFLLDTGGNPALRKKRDADDDGIE